MSLVNVIIPMFSESIPDFLFKTNLEDSDDKLVSCGGGHYNSGHIPIERRLKGYIIKKGLRRAE